MNWYATYKLSSYDMELAYLRDHLKHGFDPYDFMSQLRDFLQSHGDMKEEWKDLDEEQLIEEWLKVADDKDKSRFRDWITYKNDNDTYSPYYQPAYMHMDFKRISKPGWLVHFTSDPYSIRRHGFLYGHPVEYGYEGLALTTWKQNRKTGAGFNFAFEAFTKGADIAASSAKYGKHCVIFWSAGVEVYHYGDSEYQVLFWGPSVNKSMIFAIYNGDNGWCAESPAKDFCFDNFESACSWVVENYRMIQNIRDKSERKRRQVR